MSEWEEYTGSEEQIAELGNAKDGVCLRFEHSHKSFVYSLKDISKTDGKVTLSNTVTHYLICNPRPLADMICQQARTGQPVWWKSTEGGGTGLCHEHFPPFAHPDAFEYSFTEFEEEV